MYGKEDGAPLEEVTGDVANALIGTTIAAQYRLIEIIGEGSVGVVYRAHQESVGRDVAVKVLKRRYQKHDSIAQRFENEAKVISQLRHPNTVKVIDYHRTAAGDLCMVTELLRGTSLRAMLDEGPLPVDRAIRIAVQICGSLAEAHSAGIVHRDLKPENIFLDRVGGEDHVKVLDFGIAKFLQNDSLQTHANMVVGTPTYMSPEQSRSEKPDRRADIYSLGVLLHEMVVGKPPFSSDTAIGVMVQHISEMPPPISKLVDPNVLLPEDLEPFILQMLEKDREKRPDSIEEVRDQLLRIGSTMQVYLPTDPAVRVLRPSSKSNVVLSEAPTVEVPLPASKEAAASNGASPAPAHFDEPPVEGPPTEVHSPRSTTSPRLEIRDRFPLGRIALLLAIFLIGVALLIHFMPLSREHDVVLISRSPDPAAVQAATLDVTLTSDPDGADVIGPDGALLGKTALHFALMSEGVYRLDRSDGRHASVHLDPASDRGKIVHVVLQEAPPPGVPSKVERTPAPRAAPKPKKATAATNKLEPSEPLPPTRTIDDNPLPVKLDDR